MLGLKKQHLDVGFPTVLGLQLSVQGCTTHAGRLLWSCQSARLGAGPHESSARAAYDYVSRGRTREFTSFVQIESVAGFERLEDIVAVDGIDRLFIEPSSLSTAFGVYCGPAILTRKPCGRFIGSPRHRCPRAALEQARLVCAAGTVLSARRCASHTGDDPYEGS